MKTDDLIRILASDGKSLWRVGNLLTVALLAAVPISVAAFFIEMGVRPDIATAVQNPFFDLKFAVTISLALSALALSLHLSRPEATLRGVVLILAVPVLLLAGGIVVEMMLPQHVAWFTRLVGRNAKICLTAIPILSMPFLAAALVALRHGAPARPTSAGAFAGLLSAGLAATLYAAHCTDDSPLFVAIWYTLATLPVVAIGALAGSRVLRY
jgi:hypothetical protein